MGIGTSELGKLDETELKIIRTSWEDIMENLGENGPYIFGRFLKKYNYYFYFRKFSSIPADKVNESVEFKDHSVLVMNAINDFVTQTSDEEEIKEELFKIGRLHTNKNLSSQQFLELKSIIIDIMNKKFHLPLETLKIWSKAFDISYFYIFQVLEASPSTSAKAN